MPKLPAVTGREAIRAFEKAGFAVERIRGSHHILKREGFCYKLSIPVHKGKTLSRGLLRRQLKLAGLSQEQFLRLL